MPSGDELTSFSGTNQICGIVEDLTVHSMAWVSQLAYLRLVVLLVYFDSYIFVVAISVLIGIGLEVDDACQYLVLSCGISFLRTAIFFCIFFYGSTKVQIT